MLYQGSKLHNNKHLNAFIKKNIYYTLGKEIDIDKSSCD